MVLPAGLLPFFVLASTVGVALVRPCLVGAGLYATRWKALSLDGR
ncbi:hypothetical protein [Haloferax sp. YSMS24]